MTSEVDLWPPHTCTPAHAHTCICTHVHMYTRTYVHTKSRFEQPVYTCSGCIRHSVLLWANKNLFLIQQKGIAMKLRDKLLSHPKLSTHNKISKRSPPSGEKSPQEGSQDLALNKSSTSILMVVWPSHVHVLIISLGRVTPHPQRVGFTSAVGMLMRKKGDNSQKVQGMVSRVRVRTWKALAD